ncbi:MAG: alanine--tRNA ligase [Candidatus Aminicenantes bacterium]|nr:alanine--tRNA ligase [Candidatus Aminicenantes bacterium]
MTSQWIRELFLDFFAKKDHKIIKSSPLLPKDDPTILFTNAGMNQFKNVFLGLESRSYKRAASVQKCMRVSGKHNDLDEVGRTTKHHTFFEMLGNFSFGDYFKEEAVSFGWEFITETLGLNKDQLYVTVYLDDDEAFDIWNKQIGVPSDRIFRFGKKDNFWAMGETGPCGPCSEIHYDLDPEAGNEDIYTLIESGSDRVFELWNLVFMQFYQDDSGRMTPLPSPSIDTGMGLERLAAVLQKKNSNFETDLFFPLIDRVGDAAGIEYGSDEQNDTALRIVADHLRAVCFLIGDGIMPANDGRGYVLRRIIRRAYRFGNALGLNEPFLYSFIGSVCDLMKAAYPELLTSAEYIAKICLSEEERFARTLASGLKTFTQYVTDTIQKKKTVLSGKNVFKLYDTYGFPLEVSRELAEESGIRIDEEGFQAELEKQKEKARKAWQNEARTTHDAVYEPLQSRPTEFVGYDSDVLAETDVSGLLKDGEFVDALQEGDEGEIFLTKTPFYAEAGGQVGDTGVLKNPRFSAAVLNTRTPLPGVYAHRIKVLSGRIQKGDQVEATINTTARQAISRNHTATHLLHASLRQILGDHVKQAGSMVAPDRLRFDFTHFSGLSPEEIVQIEERINEKIRENIDVRTAVMSLEEGLHQGAMAIFEEKYGETVRLVSVADFSRELCGGVHVRKTGEIGLFKILSETSVAAGMRRIEAVTGSSALGCIQEMDELLKDIRAELHVPRAEIISQIEKMREQARLLEKENKSLRQKIAQTQMRKNTEENRTVRGVTVHAQLVGGVNRDELRTLTDNIRQKIGSGVVVLGTVVDTKVLLTVSVSKDLVNRISAAEIVRLISPLVNGGGGGRPDFAQAGGSDPSGLNNALEESYAAIDKLLKPGM